MVPGARARFGVTDHRSATDGTIVLYARPNGLGWSRLGMSVSGRLGDSVTRNRFKRICREAFRLHKSELPVGFDFIVIPRGRLERTLDATVDSLVKLSRRLCEAKV